MDALQGEKEGAPERLDISGPPFSSTSDLDMTWTTVEVML